MKTRIIILLLLISCASTLSAVNLACSPKAGGKITTSGDKITAVPNSGYAFSKWSIKVNSQSPQYSTNNPYDISGWVSMEAIYEGLYEVTITANFTAATTYTITWKNWDGSTLTTTQVSKGATPSYTGSTPTRPSTAEYAYAFSGWTPTVVAASANATYTATYTSTPRYTVSFDANGGIIPSDGNMGNTPAGHITTLDDSRTHGSVVVTTGRTDFRTMTNDCPSRDHYSFLGWYTATTGGEQVYSSTGSYVAGTYWGADGKWIGTSDVQLYAQWLAETYTITWKNYDGTVLSSGPVSYGSVPTYTGPTPTKPATEEYSYIFNGWSPNITTVTKDATYTATFTGVDKSISYVPGLFSISATKKVSFAKGNLQYKASTQTWRFAEHQWDFVGDATHGTVYENNEKCNNNLISHTYSGWIDLFGFSTYSTYLGVSSSADNIDYTGDFVDWGSIIGSGWHTLTKDEWNYLLFNRPSASALRCYITVNGVKGLFIFPDIDFWLNHQGSIDYPYNGCTLSSYDELLELEQKGGLFLPASLGRIGTEVTVPNDTYGYYQTATTIDDLRVYGLYFSTNVASPYDGDRYYGRSVRLSYDVATYIISVNPSSIVEGSTNGGGEYIAGTNLQISATPNACYQFVQWSDGNTDNPRTVTVTGNTTYTAEFEKIQYNIIFRNYNGTELQNSNWDCGSTPTYTGSLPTKPTTIDWKYSFAGWNPDVVAVTGDATYAAQYDSVPNCPINGTCGDNLTWELSCDSVLTISGTGAMTDYYISTGGPWSSKKSSIKSVVISEGVTSIGRRAFVGCSSITSVTIPNSVTSIGNYAFCNCTNLTSAAIPNSITTIGSSAFYNCTSLTAIEIPNSVTSIGDYAYKGCSGLTSVIIGNSVTSIEESTFSNCTNLTSVTIPNSVTSISSSAFANCTSLTSVIIPNSVTTIGGAAFYQCSGLTSVIIGNNVTSIGQSAFYHCTNLVSIEIPNSISSIGKFAFDGCTGLTTVYISDIAAWCAISFGSASSNPLGYAHNLYLNGVLVTDLAIPNNVASIGNDAFYNCDCLTSVTIPNSVTSIGNYAFYLCSNLSSVTMHPGVTSIGQSTFGCCKLTTVTIPNTVTSIGDYAFAYSGIIDDVYVEWTTPLSISTGVFSPAQMHKAKLHVPCGTTSAYSSAAEWGEFGTIVEPKYTITSESDDEDQGTTMVTKP